MRTRLLGVLCLALLLSTAALAGTAAAAEPEGEDEAPEHAEMPSIEEVGTQTETSLEYFPEGYEQPPLFGPVVITLMIVAAVVLLVVLVLYLLWQPRFAEERKAPRRR